MAQETITYTYDARARLIEAGRCGAINNGLSSNYGYDAADNRANVTTGVANATALSIGPTTLPRGTTGVTYSQTITAAVGLGAYSYSVSAGSLPTGLTLNSSTGVISGTPSTANTYSFTIKAVDCKSNTGSRSYSVAIGAASLTLAPATLPTATIGAAYSQTISASGGSGSYSYHVNSGSLPAGLSLNGTTGVISGTPFSAQNSTFSVTATDSSNHTGSRSYTMAIGLSLKPTTLPAGTVGAAYSQRVLTSGGSGSVSFSIAAGSLPTGLTLNSLTGAISGTPSVANNYSFTIKATDSLNDYGSRSYTVPIKLALGPTSLPGGTYGVAYSEQISASGGSGSYTFAAGSGLPPGLSLNSAGRLSGTPTSSGTYNFTVTASDTGGHTGSRSYSVAIGLSVGPATLPNGSAGTAYDLPLTASGGTGSYTYRLGSGTLPPGLGVIVDGSISGTPTSAGTYSFAVTATDSANNTGSRSYTVGIGLGVSPASLPGGSVGTSYGQQISASGGSGAYSFTAGSGVPPGLTLSSAGLLSGTPTGSGTYNFAVTANDSAGQTGNRSYSLAIGAAATCGGVSFSVANTSASAPYPLNFTVTKTGPTTINCSVHYATSDGGAVAGVNYVATSGTLTFTKSQTSLGVQVNTIAGEEKNVAMKLNLSAPSSGATLTNSSAGGTILKVPGSCRTC